MLCPAVLKVVVAGVVAAAAEASFYPSKTDHYFCFETLDAFKPSTLARGSCVSLHPIIVSLTHVLNQGYGGYGGDRGSPSPDSVPGPYMDHLLRLCAINRPEFDINRPACTTMDTQKSKRAAVSVVVEKKHGSSIQTIPFNVVCSIVEVVSLPRLSFPNKCVCYGPNPLPF